MNQTRGVRRAGAVVSTLVALALVATACGTSSATSNKSTALTSVTIGELSPGSAGGFLNMAQEKGFYKQFGVDLHIETFASAAQLAPALIGGSIDLAIEDPEQMLIATSKGAFHAKVIGSPMPGLPWAIYSAPSITSLKQLPGKSMAVSTPTGLNEIVAKLILQKEGVDPATIHFVNAGSNADKFDALVAGTVSSASIPSDYVPLAPKYGIHVLATAAQVIPLYPRWAIIATDSFLSAHPQAAVGYLAALIKGERYAFAHQKAADALAASVIGGQTKASSPEVTDMYTQIVKEHLVNKDGEFPIAQLNYLQQNLVHLGLLTKPVPTSEVYTNTYRLKALKLLGS